MSRPQRDALAIYNERLKLSAQTVNALGIGMVGFAVLRPLTESLSNLSYEVGYWSVAGLAMHIISRYILRNLRRETRS